MESSICVAHVGDVIFPCIHLLPNVPKYDKSHPCWTGNTVVSDCDSHSVVYNHIMGDTLQRAQFYTRLDGRGVRCCASIETQVFC